MIQIKAATHSIKHVSAAAQPFSYQGAERLLRRAVHPDPPVATRVHSTAIEFCPPPRHPKPDGRHFPLTLIEHGRATRWSALASQADMPQPAHGVPLTAAKHEEPVLFVGLRCAAVHYFADMYTSFGLGLLPLPRAAVIRGPLDDAPAGALGADIGPPDTNRSRQGNAEYRLDQTAPKLTAHPFKDYPTRYKTTHGQ